VRLRGERKSSAVAALDRLRALYDEVDALFEGVSCDASTDCCRFGITGREPYPSAIEIAELERAVRARGGLPKRRSLPQVDERRCALLSDDGRCTVYASRPFGCRTFFCERGHGPAGEAPPALRDPEIVRLSRAIAALSAELAPRDPGPRPLSRVMAAWESKRR
jgi:Fe-S-cluster containining protein